MCLWYHCDLTELTVLASPPPHCTLAAKLVKGDYLVLDLKYYLDQTYNME